MGRQQLPLAPAEYLAPAIDVSPEAIVHVVVVDFPVTAIPAARLERVDAGQFDLHPDEFSVIAFAGFVQGIREDQSRYVVTRYFENSFDKCQSQVR